MSGGYASLWRLDGSSVAAGDEVELEIEAEGSQRSDLPCDVAAALAANPRAGEFFDGLVQFYRRGYPALDQCHEAKPGEAGPKDRPDRRSARRRCQRLSLTVAPTAFAEASERDSVTRSRLDDG
jgi:hypothetical protein